MRYFQSSLHPVTVHAEPVDARVVLVPVIRKHTKLHDVHWSPCRAILEIAKLNRLLIVRVKVAVPCVQTHGIGIADVLVAPHLILFRRAFHRVCDGGRHMLQRNRVWHNLAAGREPDRDVALVTTKRPAAVFFGKRKT